MEGSTVGFFEAPAEPGVVPGEELRRYTLVHAVGHAVMHDGKAWHRTDPITRGTRVDATTLDLTAVSQF